MNNLEETFEFSLSRAYGRKKANPETTDLLQTLDKPVVDKVYI